MHTESFHGEIHNEPEEKSIFSDEEVMRRFKILGPRHIAVLSLLSDGVRRSREIAKALCIAEGTVGTYLQMIYATLGVHKDKVAVKYYNLYKEKLESQKTNGRLSND